jgi:predicted  nucleic acid-binding Zn-ribbon protein
MKQYLGCNMPNDYNLPDKIKAKRTADSAAKRTTEVNKETAQLKEENISLKDAVKRLEKEIAEYKAKGSAASSDKAPPGKP